MRRGIDQLRVIGDHVFFQTLRDGAGEARLEIQQQFIGEREEVEIALHLALGVDEQRVTALAELQRGDVVRDLAVEKLHAIRADDTHAAAKTQVQRGGGCVQRGVLCGRVGVVQHHFRAVLFAEHAADFSVQFVEGK